MAQLPGLVSVIVPTFNRVRLLLDTIQTVLDQTYANFEIIVVDDASSDGTASELCATFAGDFEAGRIRLVRNSTNRERSYSRNRGLALSRGEFVCFLDDDDRLLPNHFQLCLAAINSCDAVSGQIRVINQMSQHLYDYKWPLSGRLTPNEAALMGIGICPVSSLLRRAVIEYSGPFNENLNQAEDIDFYMRIAMVGTIAHIDEITVERVNHDRHYTFDKEDAVSRRFLSGLEAMVLANFRAFKCRPTRRWLGYFNIYLAQNGLVYRKCSFTIYRVVKALFIYPRMLPSEFRLVIDLLSKAILKSNPITYAAAKRWLRQTQ